MFRRSVAPSAANSSVLGPTVAVLGPTVAVLGPTVTVLGPTVTVLGPTVTVLGCQLYLVFRQLNPPADSVRGSSARVRER